jgi:hypothetical protein
MSLKHLVAAVAVGAALIVAPVAANAVTTTHKSTTHSHVAKKPAKSTKHGKNGKHTPAKNHKNVGKSTKHTAGKSTGKSNHLAKAGTKGWKHHPTV